MQNRTNLGPPFNFFAHDHHSNRITYINFPNKDENQSLSDYDTEEQSTLIDHVVVKSTIRETKTFLFSDLKIFHDLLGQVC